jgi:hypothetical protein
MRDCTPVSAGTAPVMNGRLLRLPGRKDDPLCVRLPTPTNTCTLPPGHAAALIWTLGRNPP